MSKSDILVIPSKEELLPNVDRRTEKFMKKTNFSRDRRDDIAISVSEAVSNAIHHGNGNDSLKKVTIRYKLLPDCLLVEVEDQGKGFNEKELPNPTDEQNLLLPSGRGLLIIKHLMDEVDIDSGPNGTRIQMKKYF